MLDVSGCCAGKVRANQQRQGLVHLPGDWLRQHPGQDAEAIAILRLQQAQQIEETKKNHRDNRADYVFEAIPTGIPRDRLSV